MMPVQEKVMTCGTTTHFVSARMVSARYALIERGLASNSDLAMWLVINSQPHECDFEGEVEVEYSGDRFDAWGEWTCPSCGEDHRFDVSDDPDRERDDR